MTDRRFDFRANKLEQMNVREMTSLKLNLNESKHLEVKV